MGRGIGHRLVAGGHDVTVVDRDPEEAERLAEELRGAAPLAAVRARRPPSPGWGAALQQGGAPQRTKEHAIAVTASGVLLGASLLGARFPRLVAWPLTAVGGAIGGLGLLRAARRRSLG